MQYSGIEYIILPPRSSEFFHIDVDASGIYVVAEEAGTLWISAFPKLLGWPVEIAWLFPKVAGEGIGDLWGVDANGDLLIVETKRSTSARRLEDPFEDFIADDFLKDPILFKADTLGKEWEKLFKQELLWIQMGCKMPKRSAPGVVPYSYHRDTILRWLNLYKERLIPILQSDRYPVKVREFLDRRSQLDNPLPHFMGLYTVTHPKLPGLSEKGQKHFQHLVNKVGRERVHQCAVRGVSLGADGARIESVEVEPGPMIEQQ